MRPLRLGVLALLLAVPGCPAGPGGDDDTSSYDGDDDAGDDDAGDDDAGDDDAGDDDAGDDDAGAPLVAFAPAGARALVFVNNPEQLWPGDLGDVGLGDACVYRDTLTGELLVFFEHLNHTGAALGYGLQLYNGGNSTLTVTVHGAGWVVGMDGGTPFQQLFSGWDPQGSSQALAPGASTWVVRHDTAVPDGQFFSGAIGLDIAGGAAILNAIAYQSFGALDGSTTDLGYVQRIEPDGTHEARTYKGTSPWSETVASGLDLVVDDATPAGALPVRYATYDLGAETYAVPHEDSQWVTHIGPAMDAAAITSDMASLEMPGWGTVDPLAPSDGEGQYPNLGNWGVVTVVSGSVENAGTTARSVGVELVANPGGGANLAYRDENGAWHAVHLDAGDAQRLVGGTVDPGVTEPFEARMVLGGPSAGALRWQVVVDP